MLFGYDSSVHVVGSLERIAKIVADGDDTLNYMYKISC